MFPFSKYKYIVVTYYLYLILRANSPDLNGQVNSAAFEKIHFFREIIQVGGKTH